MKCNTNRLEREKIAILVQVNSGTIDLPWLVQNRCTNKQ